VVRYIAGHTDNLKTLLEALASINPAEVTKELNRIREVAAKSVKNTYPWEGTTCRSVGDLLIALQSKSGKVLISSNYKEHAQMCAPLGYKFKEFPVSSIRSK
jgi:hypothetical protein